MSALSIKYESYFLNMVYSGRSLQDIVDEGGKILGTPIRFSPENRIEYAICSPGYPREDIQYITDLLKRDGGKLDVFLKLSGQEHPEKPFFSYPGPWEARIFCNVIIGARYFGNLSIPQVNVDLKTIDLDTVQMIARTIALACAVTGAWGYDITRDNLLQRILSGMVDNQDEMLSYLGSSIEIEGRRWKLVCARIPEGKKPVILQTALQRGFPGSPVVVHGHMAVMLLDVTQEDLKPRQMEELRSVAATYGCALGVSMAFDNILQCREHMLCLSEHPQMVRGEPGVFDYSGNAEYALLFSSRLDRDRLLELFGSRLCAIRAHDRENGTAYFDTICTYLNCSYHIQKTADALHTHKNTLLYRIARIQELFGVDLRSNRDLYELNLGMSALRYFGEV